MITKKLFLDTLTCPTYGWYSLHKGNTQATSLHDQLLIEEGLELHQRARKLYPEGVSINGDNLICTALTKIHLNNKITHTIFEATFIVDNYVTKADILTRSQKGWDLYEIKSSTNKDSKKIEDMAYTAMLAKKSGLKINSCKLLIVSKDYRLGMPDEKLFEEDDVTDEVFGVVEEFEDQWDKVPQCLNKKEIPKSERKYECKKCEFYNKCFNTDTKDTIFELPYIDRSKYDALVDLDVFKIADIPEDFKLSDFQSIVRQTLSSGKSYINKDGLRIDLESIVYPAYYLDFETTQTCIPIYEDTDPYAQIATQYSIHICSAVGEVVEHLEYLADHDRDCRRELAGNLIRDCGTEGSIITYTHFEKTIIKGLMKSFPVLEEQLNALIDRIVDLHKIIRNNYYDSKFRGRTSIKKVLPVVVSDLSYDGMSIGDGLLASAVFAYMAKGRYDNSEIVKLREDLLEYCKLDTLAMVRLCEKLAEIV